MRTVRIDRRAARRSWFELVALSAHLLAPAPANGWRSTRRSRGFRLSHPA